MVGGTGAGYVKAITALRQKRERILAAQALQEFGDVLYSHSNVKVNYNFLCFLLYIHNL